MQFTHNFRQIIHTAYSQLSQIPIEKRTQKPAPNKWSPIEIIGHLIDSANNNHRRFIKAQWQKDLIFNGYAQNDWVSHQKYQEANWEQIIGLWKFYNLHICRIMENTPEEKLNKEITKHNFHQIAWKTVPQTRTVTLAYFMKDYIGHLEHHLRQIEDML